MAPLPLLAAQRWNLPPWLILRMVKVPTFPTCCSCHCAEAAELTKTMDTAMEKARAAFNAFTQIGRAHV